MQELSATDHDIILKTIKRGKNAREICRANALNMRDKGLSVIEIADFLEITPRTVINICNTFEENGIEIALKDDPRPGRPPKYDARVETKIVATVCSKPPEGFDRWTLELLRERLIEDKVVSSIGKEKIRVVLREHDLKPWLQRMWCVPKLDEEYISRMEDVLDMYEKAYNRLFPVVCLDEKPAVLHSDVRRVIPMTEGQPRRVDYEYKRCGTANIFCAVEPKVGKYFNKVTASRASSDFAKYLKDLSLQYPDAKKIILVMDNLSTHKEKSLTDFFGEQEGKSIWKRFDVHYTPKHASWLNQAEIAISMLQRQCLGTCRIPDIETLKKRTDRWNKAVNNKKVIIKWDFFKDDAREKFDYK